MLTLNESIILFQNGMNTYYSLWVFYFTASAGILGFIYGGQNNSQLLNTVVASILYLIVVMGNSSAIFTTQKFVKQIEIEIKQVSKRSEISTPKEGLVPSKQIVQNLAISNIENVKSHYYLGTMLVFSGIWFPYFKNARKNGFKSTMT